MFGGGATTGFGTSSSFGAVPQNISINSSINPTQQAQNVQPRDFEVTSPPDDSVSCLQFSPPTIPQIFLIAGSWDNNVIIHSLYIHICS